MKTSNYSEGKVIKNFERLFDKAGINRLGKSTGFARRRAQKITAYHFVLGFIACCHKQVNTFGNWAAQIELLSGQRVSLQAIFGRLYNGGAAAFAEKLLQQAIIGQSRAGAPGKLFGGFKKVLLQDSTTLRLPDVLAAVFKGNTTGGQQKSQVRIQTTINVKTMRFVEFVLSGFAQNDQSASGQVLPHIGRGDLVIRDLGYFAMEVLKGITGAEAHFLSRLKYGVCLYSPAGKPVRLSTLLNRRGIVDMRVCIGKQRLPVRLVMLPLPRAQAAERVRKARHDRDKRLNHSPEYYRWLAYSVFVTTVGGETWGAAQVGEAYKVRWQIEIVFKSWKSGGNMQAILHENVANEERVRTSICLFLLFICLLIDKVYMPLRQKIERQREKYISLLKFMAFMFKNFTELICLSSSQLTKIIGRHCCYEHRTDRLNMTDVLYNFKN
jgi:hypothetical protein